MQLHHHVRGVKRPEKRILPTRHADERRFHEPVTRESQPREYASARLVAHRLERVDVAQARDVERVGEHGARGFRGVSAAARGHSQPEAELRSPLAPVDVAQRDHAERVLRDFASYRERELALSAYFRAGVLDPVPHDDRDGRVEPRGDLAGQVGRRGQRDVAIITDRERSKGEAGGEEL